MKTLLAILTACLLAAAPAAATVAEGVAEWRAGNHREAVLLWLPAAARGRCRDMGARRGEEAEAIRLWRESADAGDAHARYMLGMRYFNGRGVERDLPRAYAFMTLAKEQGLEQAERALGRMEAALGSADKTSGRAMAAEMRGRPAAGLASAVPAQRAPARAAAANEAAASAAQPQVRSESIPAGQESAFRVQLGAYGDRAQAETGWSRIQARFPSLFRSTDPVYRTFDGGIRLRVGEFDERAEAVDYCEEIKAAGQPCFVAAEE